MGYDRGDSSPFDFILNGTPSGSENRKENFSHDHIPFNMKGNRNSFPSVDCCIQAARDNKAWGSFLLGFIFKPQQTTLIPPTCWKNNTEQTRIVFRGTVVTPPPPPSYKPVSDYKSTLSH